MMNNPYPRTFEDWKNNHEQKTIGFGSTQGAYEYGAKVGWRASRLSLLNWMLELLEVCDRDTAHEVIEENLRNYEQSN